MTATPLLALMVAPVLSLQPVVGFLVLIPQVTVELGMLPGRQALLVGLVMLFVELIVDIVVALVEPVVLPVMTALPVLRHRWR
jgi:hypothetical protein